MTALSLVAIGFAILGALLAYAGAGNQRLIAARHPFLRVAGWALLALALVMLLLSMGTPAAIFTWLSFAMLVWSTVPLIAAWRRHRGGRT